MKIIIAHISLHRRLIVAP